MKNSGTFKVCQAGGMEKTFICTMAGISEVKAFCSLLNSDLNPLMFYPNNVIYNFIIENCFVVLMAD